MPSPFARTPHPIAQHAALLLRARLPPTLADGKMFGVLVVRDRDGRIGYLAAFSGMRDGSWHAPGFVPPLFDEAARAAFWPAGEAELDAIAAELTALETAEHAALAALDARHAAELAALRARHRERRDLRRAARSTLVDAGAAHRLDQESRADAAEKRKLLARHAAEREPIARAAAADEARRRVLVDERAAKSRRYLHALFDTYELVNARGERCRLRTLFAPGEPPGGAGDCAAPKLLGHAYRECLEPVAFAELWWGEPPATGGRHHGTFYPACRGKCGPVLGHMLQGLDVEPAPVFGAAPIAPDAPQIVFEDAWLAVVEKPAGLLSVPGRSDALRDSVQTRLAARFGEAFVVHRLDLDVSGLLMVAKDRETHVALQRLFASREIAKRYVAWLDGDVAADHGVVDLALRVDLDDRPRQIVDPAHGKPARTEWRVLGRSSGRTKVELVPRTGRSHQLRVHAAHPAGIGVPILGDPLYGREAARLHLHGAHIGFVHPHTKARIEVNSLPPF